MKSHAALAIAMAVTTLAPATPASAHRLDEYLQATRVAIGVDRVGIEIDLTPGVNVAPTVLGWIDANHDGRLSQDEADSYARQVIRDLALDVDGESASLTISHVEVAQPEVMRLGTGSVRVRAAASVLPSPGHHRVTIRNHHRPESSVYLANALVPEDARVHLRQQMRDRAQRDLAVDYDVAGSAQQAGWLLAGVGAIGALVIGRRRSRRR